MRPEHLSLFRQLGTPAVHPSGDWAVVAISRPDLDEDSYPSALWRVDIASGELTPLTYGTGDSQPVFSPDGAWLAFLRADQKPQLALMASDGAEPRILTAHPLGVDSAPVFSPDSARVAYTARVPEEGRYGTADGVGPDAEPPRHITQYNYRVDGVGFYADRPAHVFVADVPGTVDPAADPVQAPKSEDGAPEPLGVPGVQVVQVTSSNVGHSTPTWTPDGDLLTLRSRPDAISNELVRHGARDRSDGAVIDLGTLVPSRVACGAGGELWLLLRDLGADQMDFIGRSAALYSAELSGSAVAGLTRHTDPTTDTLTEVLEPVPGGVALVGESRGNSPVLRFDGELSTVFGGVRGASAVAPMGGADLLVVAADPGSVGDLWIVSSSGHVRRLTDLSARLRSAAGVCEPQELEADSDGYPVHGWVAQPAGDGPHPVLLLIHGGPAAQYTPMFFDEVQAYTEAGYAVVFCNPRGSTGYGEQHARAITGGFGDKDAADIMAFLDAALAAHPWLDGGRVGVLGGSYGGYMTAWLTTQTNRFVAAIVERGFLDPVSFVGSADIGWFFPHAYLGTAPEQIAAQSPMAHVQHVRTPTLVIHSEQDWRCPVEQGQRWFTELRLRGVETELLLFPGEGHELSRSGRPKHRIARFEHILRWWKRHLPVG